jgi:hypothetical protein
LPHNLRNPRDNRTHTREQKPGFIQHRTGFGDQLVGLHVGGDRGRV